MITLNCFAYYTVKDIYQSNNDKTKCCAVCGDKLQQRAAKVC